MDFPVTCTAFDYAEALEQLDVAPLLERKFLYLSPKEGDLEDLWFHSAECALPDAGCDLPGGTVIRLPFRDRRKVLGDSILVDLTACPSASPADQLAIAASSASSAHHVIRVMGVGSRASHLTHASYHLGLAPQVRPGLWEHLAGSSTTAFMELAKQWPSPLAQPLVDKVEAATAKVDAALRTDLGDAHVGTGPLWWVAYPMSDLRAVHYEGLTATWRARLVTQVPLHSFIPCPEDELVLWQVPQSWVSFLRVSNAAWVTVPVSARPHVDALALRAVAESNASSAAEAAELAAAVVAAQTA